MRAALFVIPYWLLTTVYCLLFFSQPEPRAVFGREEEGADHLVVVGVRARQARVELRDPVVEAFGVADLRVARAAQVGVVALPHELAVVGGRAAQLLGQLGVEADELGRVEEGARHA